MNERSHVSRNGNGRLDPSSSAPNRECGTNVPQSSRAPGLAALIAEAESLHAALGDARTRAGRLTEALRRYRRNDRLVAGAFASLRSLELQELSG
jgi:hypothetical protein